MRPGEIFEGYFKYQNSDIGKYRPFLVLQSDDTRAQALICKITTSYPSASFPHRVPISRWQEASLQKFSHAQVDNNKIVPYHIRKKYIGMINNEDYKTIIGYFVWLYPI
ncbi:type II toxin-antitoxin system PemK/MazF family toxin [Virgibacillus sp. FSP13]